MTGDKAFLSLENLSSRLCKSAERVPNTASLPNVSQTVQVCRTCPKHCKSAERVPYTASLPNVSQTLQICRTCPKHCKSAERVPNSASLPNVSPILFFSKSPIKGMTSRQKERTGCPRNVARNVYIFGKVTTANEVWTVDLRSMCLLNDIPR